MTVKYKIIERGQPGVTGGGTKKYYASANAVGKVTLSQLSKEISARSSLTPGDVLNVLEQFVTLVPDKLLEGYTVRLGDLGTFSITLNSQGEATSGEVTAGSIKRARIQFRAGARVRNAINTVKFEKA